MKAKLPKHYDFSKIEQQVYALWMEARAFAASPDARENRYVIMMPLPNVTGALHVGHAMDNLMQDLLIRWHRMMGDNTLWMPGTDHAGIATQAVVEKRLFELEGKTRRDIGREALVQRIWTWKDEYQQRIIQQQQVMGCSCDWDRQRFTMDAVCTRAVREAFFRLFKAGLIYRGNRLVNWDCQLQTVIADDEVVHDTIQGHFWHIRYPVIDPHPGEPVHVVLATTRPETMLGDTAVACHPDPAGALEACIRSLRERIAKAPRKERALLEEELRQVEERIETLLPNLMKLNRMAREGRKVLLPLVDREIPLILDEWAKPELGTGCVKITPAHDPNDYEVWQRHKDEIGIINILRPEGRLNEQAGPYAGLDRFEARKRILEDLEHRSLIERIEDREIEIGHSDRSQTPIEPYLSRQWFIKMGDVEEGLEFGRNTGKEFRAPGLAQAAIDAIDPNWQTSTGRRLRFYPDPERYAGTYRNWLAEKRDWCISRQLWWGHRIPIWSASFPFDELRTLRESLPAGEAEGMWAWIAGQDGSLHRLDSLEELDRSGRFDLLVCLHDQAAEGKYAAMLEQLGLKQDPDVLDTWFSSALWPFSTLGWPSPSTAPLEPEQTTLGAEGDRPDCLEYYYPGSCLVTARDIITLWVARMTIMGLYFLGDVPFTDCFIHTNIQDGSGVRMSKSRGNGIDPVDICNMYGTDAMRYVLCDMQTGSQDTRLPLQAVSPFTGKLIDLATASHGRTVFTYICPETGNEFDVLGTLPDLPSAKIISDRFDAGRAFCTKLWNAARFALMNLGEHAFQPVDLRELAVEDRWILSRLSRTVAKVTACLKDYSPSAALGAAREFFWSDLCDWYLELIKARLKDPKAAPVARTVLALALDQVLRLFHPLVPFITESLWEKLGDQCPQRGLDAPLECSRLLLLASWPIRNAAWEDEAVERDMLTLQDVIRSIRDLRARHGVPPGKRLDASIKAGAEKAASLSKLRDLVIHLTNLNTLQVGGHIEKPPLSATQVVGELELYLTGVLDPAKERARLGRQLEKLTNEQAVLEKNLSNERFLSRAPAKVVEAQRDKLREAKTQVAIIAKSLEAIPADKEP